MRRIHGRSKSKEEDSLVEPVRLRLRGVFASRCCPEVTSGAMSSSVFQQIEARMWKWCFHGRCRKTGRWLREASAYYESLSAVPEHRRLMRLGDLRRYASRLGASAPSEACALYRRAIIARPDDGSAYNALGVVFAAQGLAVSAAYSYARAAASPRPFAPARANLAALAKAKNSVATLGISFARASPDVALLDRLLRAAKLSRRLLFELAVVAVFKDAGIRDIGKLLLAAAPHRPAVLPALVILADACDDSQSARVLAQLPERRHLRTFRPLAAYYASRLPPSPSLDDTEVLLFLAAGGASGSAADLDSVRLAAVAGRFDDATP